LTRDEHFEKYVERLDEVDLINSLEPDQILISGALGGLAFSELVRHVNRPVPMIQSMRTIYNFLGTAVVTRGTAVAVVATLKKEEDLLKVSAAVKTFRFSNRKFVCSWKDENREETVADKSIVIYGIEPQADMHRVLRELDVSGGLLNFEYASKYYNPIHPVTSDLIRKLQNQGYLEQAESGTQTRRIEIHEREGLNVNVITLNPQFVPIHTKSLTRSLPLHFRHRVSARLPQGPKRALYEL
jgi:hypothetical protein